MKSLRVQSLVAFALAMFGVYEFRLPARLSNLGGTGRHGAAGAYLMGLTIGIVAAPCVGPLVSSVFTYVAKSADPVVGFWIFFTLAVGMGTPFVVLAVLSGSIDKLPKSNETRKILAESSDLWAELLRGQFSF